MFNMNTNDRTIYDGSSFVDFYEMMVVAWIRLVASAALVVLAWRVPLPEQSASVSEQTRDEAEKEELLLHVLE
jgi:hypothetical protein